MTIEALVFRKIKNEEIEQAVQIVESLPAEIQLAFFYWPADKLLAEFELADSIGAFLNSRLQAFILWRLNGDLAEIMCLATAYEAQKTGVMAQLLNAAITVTRCEGWILEVHESNLAAQALYRKLNFDCIGVRKDYYRDGGKALIFKRKS